MKRYEGKNIIVETYKRGGYFILRISNYRTFYVATKGSRNPHIESGFMPPYEKKFENMNHANNYFKSIRKNNPDLVLVKDEPNKYISYDGTIKEY